MDTWFILLSVGLLLVIILRAFPSKNGVTSISNEDLKLALKQKEKQWVDVRTPGEYNTNHIKTFKNIPLNELPSRTQELDAGKETYVICQSGMRSRKAAAILKKKGFNQVINIKGGMGSYRP